MTSTSRVIPDPDGVNGAHWRGAREGRVVVQVCGACGRARYPAAHLCPDCASPSAQWQAIRPTGQVLSWCRFHRAYFPEFAAAMPYTVLWVRMDDGVDLFANFAAEAMGAVPRIGERVEAVFEAVAPEAAVVRFRAMAAAPGAGMKAVVVRAVGGVEALEYAEVDDPVIGPNDLLIKVAAAGICSHDIASRKGILKRGISLPFIPGHEISGTVVATGGAVQRFRIGDRVATTQRRHVCGICDDCRTGRESYCDALVFLGHGMACGGGYAQYVAVGEENACRVPEGVSMADASIAACAIGSGLNAVRDVGRVRAGETVLVTGAGGGLGIHAMQIARLCGARVVAVTSDASKTALLEDAGADIVVTYARGSDFSAQVRAATNGRGVDVIIDNVGTAVFQSCRRSLAREGRWVLVGELTGEFVPFNPAQLIHNGNAMLSVHSSTRAHLHDCLELLARGRIRAFVTQEYGLAQAREAHQAVESGRANGRVVLIP